MGATNSWLNNENFIKRIKFEDKYYLTELFKYLENFIKVIPISIALSWDKVHTSIYVSVGQEFKKYFPVSTDISYRDFCKLIENSIMPMYPRYELEIEKEEYLSNDEIFDIVQKTGRDIQDVLHDKKKIIVKKSGIITKIYLTKDEFKFQEIEDGIRKTSIRMSGNASENNFINLSNFLKTVRELEKRILDNYLNDHNITEIIYKKNNFNQDIIDYRKTFEKVLTKKQIKEIYKEIEEKKYNFIMKNSTFVREIDNISENEQVIDYEGKMMLNFFKINLNELKQHDIERISDEHYKIGEYNILFKSEALRMDCFKLLKQ